MILWVNFRLYINRDINGIIEADLKQTALMNGIVDNIVSGIKVHLT